MSEEEFHYLFVNANCLAELALRESMQDLDAWLTAATVPPPDDAVEPVEPSFEGLDFEALAGLDFFGGDSSIEGDIVEPAEELLQRESGPAATEPKSEPFDRDVYLDRAYRAGDELGERIAKARSRVDFARLESSLAELPRGPAPLSARLSGDQLQTWLERYLAGSELLVDVVLAIREAEV